MTIFIGIDDRRVKSNILKKENLVFWEFGWTRICFAQPQDKLLVSGISR